MWKNEQCAQQVKERKKTKTENAVNTFISTLKIVRY